MMLALSSYIFCSYQLGAGKNFPFLRPALGLVSIKSAADQLLPLSYFLNGFIVSSSTFLLFSFFTIIAFSLSLSSKLHTQFQINQNSLYPLYPKNTIAQPKLSRSSASEKKKQKKQKPSSYETETEEREAEAILVCWSFREGLGDLWVSNLSHLLHFWKSQPIVHLFLRANHVSCQRGCSILLPSKAV